jgi:hypothetical protein
MKIKNPQIKIVLNDKINTAFIPHEDCLSAFKRKVGDTIMYVPNADKALIPIGHQEGQANLLLRTIDKCFSNHFPLKITPDLLWMLVIQGVAQHVKLTKKESQTLLVKHKRMKKISITKDELLYDDSKWSEIPLDIINKFRANLVDDTILDTLIPHYSTTTPIETTAFEIGVMDVFSSFFEYWAFSLCGIPEIHLEGSHEDWGKFKTIRAIWLGLVGQKFVPHY